MDPAVRSLFTNGFGGCELSQTTIQVAFDQEVLGAAAKSGCKAFFIGLESVSQESLNSQGKGFNRVSLYERAVDNLHRYGIAIQAGTMFGLDGDDPGIFERTLKYYKEIGIDQRYRQHCRPHARDALL